MKIHRVKTWLSSFTELPMKKHGHGEKYGFFGDSLNSTTYLSAFFSTGCFLWSFRVGVVSFVFFQKHSFSCYLCFLSPKLLTAKITEYTPHYSCYFRADLKNTQFRTTRPESSLTYSWIPPQQLNMKNLK